MGGVGTCFARKWWACLVVCVAGIARGQATLPPQTFSDAAAIPAARSLVDQQNFAEAAQQFEQWMERDAGQLIASEGGVVSVATWPETFPARARAGLIKAIAAIEEPAARGKLEEMTRDAGATFEALYGLGRRYRFCLAGTEAFAAAAERALAVGDLAAAHAAYRAAVEGGYSPDEATKGRIELLRQIVEDGKTVPLNAPASQPADAAAPSSIPNARVVTSGKTEAGPWAGPVPFDAPWIVTLTGAGVPRFGLIGSEDRIVFSSAKSVAMFKETGAVVWWNANGAAQATSRPAWSTPAPPPHGPPSAAGPFKVEGFRRPALYQPGALFDVYGRVQVIVARQASGETSCLRAYRGSDGKLIWSTEAAEGLAGVNFAGTPAVSGGYTYAVAALDGEPTSVLLVALDTLSGAAKWKTVLGTLPRTKADGVYEQSEPCVWGDAVYVTPNVGVTACVGRFDGQLRWARPYPAAPVVGGVMRTRELVRQEIEAVRQYRLKKGEGGAPVLDPAVTDRWRGTPMVCGPTLVCAPQDAVDVLGFEAASGRPTWHNAGEAEAPTLVGHHGNTAIFSGAGGVVAVDGQTGQVAWRWDGGRGPKIAGPAVVREGSVVVPTVTVNVTLNATDGKVVRESLGVPTFRRAMNGEVVRRIVEEAGAGGSFGVGK